MNISYNWLKKYLDFTLTPQEVSDALTSIGLETGSVEEVQTIKGGLEGLVIGKVLTCEPHPNSDHLHVTTVDLGAGEPVQIVCGAANVAAGQKVVVAPLGSVLYDGDKSIMMKKMKLRGVESSGMICAEDEIGIGTSHEGIIVLPQDDVTPIGTPAKDYYQIKSDYVLEVDITPNRADACSHYGVARDLYAYLVQNEGVDTTLSKPTVDAFKVDNHELNIEIKVENTEACPRYTGVSIKGVTVQESPDWLKQQLTTIGLHPINNIVDITNYILHAIGQPLHAFDADKVGKQVIVKTLPAGTSFVTLDGVERKLHENDLMICSAEEPMCIGGVFGGIKSGVTEQTTNVFLESAYFHPTWIRKTARRHGLNTDASFRYERGIDPNAQIYALKLATLLIQELAGGEVASEIKVSETQPTQPFHVNLSYAQVNSLIGKTIPCETIKSILKSLEICVEKEEADSLQLLIPPYRVDVQRPCDVVEDILRIYGYNNIEIPNIQRSSLASKCETDRRHKLQNLLAEQLVGMGFNEILNNSLSRVAYYDDEDSELVHLLNPLSQDLSILRKTLLLGGMESIAYNVHRQAPNLRFFEFGNTYCKTNKGYQEVPHLALWITGRRVAASWAHPTEDCNIYELKAYIETLLQRTGISFTVMQEDNVLQFLSQKNGNKDVIATINAVERKLLRQFDIEQEVYYADINLAALYANTQTTATTYSELPRYPAVKRDLALLLDQTVSFAEIEKLAHETERKLLRDVRLFDVYEGKNMEAGKKSYAVSFLLQDENQTLTDKQIEKTMQRLVGAFQTKLGAALR